MTDTALTRGQIVRGRCTAEGVELTSLLCKASAPVADTYGERFAWVGLPAGGGDDRGAGARSGAPARARPRPQKNAGSRAQFVRRYAGGVALRYAWSVPGRLDSAMSVTTRQSARRQDRRRGGASGRSVKAGHRWSCMSSSTSSTRQGRVTADRLTELANHLIDRDREIALALYEHRILSRASSRCCSSPVVVV